jgi:uncharacterized membrane protein YsdA (DUF1294 family)
MGAVLPFSERDVALWLLAVGAVGVIAMAVDKGMAHLHWGSRLSERSLWFIALGGGFLGVILGALLFHHKTSKGSFWPPVALAVILWVILVWLLLAAPWSELLAVRFLVIV